MRSNQAVRLIGGPSHGKRCFVSSLPFFITIAKRPTAYIDNIKFVAPYEYITEHKYCYDAVVFNGKRLHDKDGLLILISDKLNPYNSKTIKKIIKQNERTAI